MNNEKQILMPDLRFPEFENLKGWKKKPFSKLFKIGSGRDYKHLGKGEVPVYGTGGYMLSVNDFLYDGKSACIGRKGTINKPILLSGKFWTVDTLFYTHSFQDCSPEFIYLLFQNINWLNYNEAGGVPSLSKVIINKIEVYIPEPKEQQKIIDFISSLDNVITAETEKLENLKDHKKGLLQQLFPSNGETKPQFRFPEFENDGDWKEDKLSDLVLNISPPKKLKSSQFQENGKYPIVDQSQNEIAGWSDDEKALVKNDFPLIVFGDHTCALKIVESPFIQGADGIKILKGDTLIETRYLFYALQSNPLIMNEYKRHYSILKDKIISYSNIATGEQQKIANCLSSADDLIEAQKTKIKTLKNHKKGLMQQLFPNLNELEE